MEGVPHMLIIAPLIVFVMFFITVLVLRSFYFLSREDIQVDQRRRVGTIVTVSSADSVVDISNNNQLQYNMQTTSNTSNPNPPGYYAEVMSTDASALYPVYVPTYAAPLMSLRDPRQFQGLPGLAAPPPYPPPPSYSQIHNFPDLPTASHAIVDAAQQPRITKKNEEVTPVE